MNNPMRTAAWASLLAHYKTMSTQKMRDMFESDSGRGQRFSVQHNDIYFDYSKNIITDETIELLINLAEEMELGKWTEDIFTGATVNNTEGRAVLHTALRDQSDDAIYVGGSNIKGDIRAVLAKMEAFVGRVHSGKWLGTSGKPINTFVNIGIGGSDLGPAMVCEALKPYSIPGNSVYFVSNIDGTDITETLKKLNPKTTLFIIASKSFTTQETLTNALTARDWFMKAMGPDADMAKHFIALSTNAEKVRDFGIDPENMFGFWDWVGGRYSLWSAIGMSIALQLGFDNFRKLLEGANSADRHFRNRPFAENIPVIMALLGIWYNNFFGSRSHAVIPYDMYLKRLPEYLQQLDMESNGKYRTRGGQSVDYATGPVIWGQPGTNAQHSFFQLLHQGTSLISADFIAPVHSHNPSGEHHKILLSNFLAQTEALMKGQTAEEARSALERSGMAITDVEKLTPHKVFPGNKPTNTFLIDKITPESLGSLIAFYEHKVFVQGVIWRLNSFDQWGVELGKQLAKAILPQIGSHIPVNNHDSSTNTLLDIINRETV